MVISETCFSHYFLNNIFIKFGSNLYRQIVGIAMGTNCAQLVTDCFCFAMKETSCCLSLTIIRLILFEGSTLLQDTYQITV